MHRHSHSRAETTPSVRVPGLFSRGKIILLALVAVAVVALLFLTELDWKQVPELLERVNRPFALLVMAVLPIVGFPISAVYLASGALFGPWIGGLVVTAVTLIHVFVTHVLARTVLRRRIEHWHKKWQHRLPEVPVGESATLVAMIVIVPGLPYIARNCLLVFSGVPLRYLLGVALPLYVARSYVTIFLGDLGNDPSRRALLILAAVFAAKMAVSALLFLRLKRRAKRTGR